MARFILFGRNRSLGNESVSRARAVPVTFNEKQTVPLSRGVRTLVPHFPTPLDTSAFKVLLRLFPEAGEIVYAVPSTSRAGTFLLLPSQSLVSRPPAGGE
eukprot:scaffold1805_cov248-Pinguiococcus_pyrenoidosus.AAC.1